MVNFNTSQKENKIASGGNLDLTKEELNKYQDVLKTNPALVGMLDMDIPKPKKESEIDPIKLMINSVKAFTKNPNMNCKEIAKFLENFDNAKKIFDDITQDELNTIIVATNNHKFCETYNSSDGSNDLLSK